MSKFKTAYTTKTLVVEAVKEVEKQLQGVRPRLILFFVSSAYDPSEVSRQMSATFEHCIVAGCTTSGEIVSGKMLDNGLVAMAMSEEAIADAKLVVLKNISGDDRVVDKAFEAFTHYWGSAPDQLNPEQYVGLVLIDGLSGQEERINERIGDLTNIPFVGGSAGDDLQFKSTYVCANGQAYQDAALLILLKPSVGFDILKTQSFCDTGKVLKVTENDEAKREIRAFNHQPAAKAYAEALGVEEAALADHMFKNPLGLMVSENEPFVRSPRVVEDKRVLFYCNVKEGMELHLLNSTDIVEDTKASLKYKEKELGKIGAIINFNCILRTLDLKQQNRTQEYADLFTHIPTIGFSTYGESYIGHINQTATMLLFQE